MGLKIADSGVLFQQMFGTQKNKGTVNPLKVSDLSKGGLNAQLMQQAKSLPCFP